MAPTGRGWRHERGEAQAHGEAGARRTHRQQAGGRACAPERSGALALPADRRVRLPLQLPHGRPGRPRRRGRLALRAAVRLAERLRRPARPPERRLPLRALRDQRARRAHLRAGHEHPRHHLAHADGLGADPRRAHHGPAPRRGQDHAAHPAAGRRGRRASARAHGAMHRGQRRARAGLRTDLRLRPRAGRMDPGR